jgi:hypothetical protein
LDTAVEDSIIECRIEEKGISFERQATGTSGSFSGEAGNADSWLIKLGDTNDTKNAAEISPISRRYDQLDTDEYSEIPE